MTIVNIAQWRVLERWSAPAFIAAGMLWLLGVIISELSIEVVPHGSFIAAYVGNIGLALGLLGLSPPLFDQSPKLTLAGTALVALAIGAQIVVPIALVGLAVQAGYPVVLLFDASMASAVFGSSLFLLISPLGSIVYGVASLRTRVPSRDIGLLLSGMGIWLYLSLLGLTVWWYVTLGGGGESGIDPPSWFGPAIGTSSLFMLAIGYLLHTDAATSEQVGTGP